MDRSFLRQGTKVPRTSRVSANLNKALAPLVASWAREHGLMVSVTHINVSPDLKNAKISVSALGGKADLAGVTAGLNADAAAFRHELSHALRMKTLPKLRFVADDSIATSARISELIGKTEDRVSDDDADDDDED